MTHLVIGGAGFIGSWLSEALIERGEEVTILDNLSTGKKEYVPKDAKLVVGNALNPNVVRKVMKNVEIVWLLASKCEVKKAAENPRRIFEHDLRIALNVLEAMREGEVERIMFTSSSTVYGEAKSIPTPETYGPLKPISTYGSVKLAIEGLITAYSHYFGFDYVIFRLANVIGPRITHGVVYDFVKKLKKNPEELEILGDGNQKKSYLHVSDCVKALLIGFERGDNEIYNVGGDDWISVREIAKIVAETLNLNPKFKFLGGPEGRGWKGDVRLMLLDTTKMKKLGWKPKKGIKRAIVETVEWVDKMLGEKR